MCGIIGYMGSQTAQPLLLSGLKRMEYRGYDSAGIAIINNDTVVVRKKAGKLHALITDLGSEEFSGTVGIGHIRWATHGVPNDINAHPHADCRNEIFIAHNGIIENYRDIKDELSKKGHAFTTQTDTEILAHLIEEESRGDVLLEQAVRASLRQVVGAYGITVLSAREPQKIVAARLSSPLVLGIVQTGEYIIASDVAAILPYTHQVVYMEDGEVVCVTPQGYRITNLEDAVVDHDVKQVEWSITQAEKKGYPHFMLKEIFEQPEVIRTTLLGHLVQEEGLAHLGGFLEYEKRWRMIDRVIIIACGTAAYAGKVGATMMEEYAGIPATVEIASEFRYRKPVITPQTAVITVSQSGETADTIASLREAKRFGALTFGIVNVVGSTVAREVDAGLYIHAGPEIAVASTKAFIGMISSLVLLTMALGRQRKMSLVTGQRIAKELFALPQKMQMILDNRDHIMALAKKYAKFDHAFFLGRKYQMAIAYEGALKLKELAYVHAEGYSAGELKHGPLALIDDRFYSVFLCPKDSVYEKNISNMQEVKARNGRIIAITTEGNYEVEDIADDTIMIPKTLEMLTPILAALPLQLFCYEVAVARGCDVDQPRNLAKSVTVE